MATYPGSPPNPLGIKVELNLNGTWTDITAFVRLRSLITISNVGRADESGSISPAQLTLTLNNADGRFTPKNTGGAYSPNLVRNCPVRLSVNATSTTGVAYSQFRFFGEVSSWPPSFDVSQRDRFVQITASGIWRRIAQSSVNIGSAYSRYVLLLAGAAGPQAYWPMEDGTNTAGFVLGDGTGTNMGITSPPSFAADGTSFPGSDALPQCNGARMRGNPSGGTATNNVVRCALSIPATGDQGLTAGSATVLSFGTAGTVAGVNVTVDTTWKLTVTGTNAGGGTLFSVQLNNALNGVPVIASVELTPSGGNVAWKLQVIKPGAGAALGSVSGSVAGTLGAVSFITLNGNGILTDTTVGQLGLWYSSVPNIVNDAAAMNGNAGETTVARFARLCAESNIATTVIGTSSVVMGPQVDGQLSDLLQNIEDTECGLLYETRDQLGLGFRTLASMQNQAAAVTVSYTAGVLGAVPAPTYDDQLIRNQWTVTNLDGYAALAVCTSGAMSTQPPPNGVGSGYAGTLQVNANTHAQVNAVAQQRLYQGCTDEVRYPTLTFNFLRAQAAPFFASVPGLRLGDRLDITSLPSFLGGGSAKQLVAGYTETMGGEFQEWGIVFNTIPEAPFESAFSPGVFSVTQAPSGTVGTGSQIGSTVAGSQAAGLPPGTLAQTLSARAFGGVVSFISAATPYDWTFAVSGTPADTSYFSCTAAQAQPIAVGDTFINTTGLGGPFTVTSVDPPSAGTATVHFTPNASSVMSAGTVRGGKNGDTWINTSGGNQVNQWTNGAWVPITWNATSVINAATINASLIAAGTIIAGAVDGTTISGAQFIAYGSTGEILIYSGTPAAGNLIGSWSGAAGTDGHTNAYAAGLEVHTGGLVLDNQTGGSPSAVTGASTIYTSSGGRLRYLSAAGADLVIDRSALNLGHFSMTTQATPVVMSGALNYLANEAQTGSEYEVEIDGTITTPTSTPQVFQFSLFVDGAILTSTANRIGLGVVMLASNPSQTFAFHLRWTLSVEVTGAGGAVTAVASGGVNQELVNLGNTQIGGGMTGSPSNLVTVGNAFDTTSNHTIQITGNWGTAPGSGSAITYRTKITRRY